MPEYVIQLLPQALQDADDLYAYITEVLHAQSTADSYLEGVFQTIHKLSYLGSSLPIHPCPFIQRQYGPNARTINYKKMSIIYVVADDTIVVSRIMAGKLIL